MSKLPRKEWRNIADSNRAKLAELYPQCFLSRKAAKMPLAVGIYDVLRRAHPDIPARDLKIALQDYTGGPTYLRAMVSGAVRIGLNGDPAGFVSAESAAYAAHKLAALIEFFETSNAARRSSDPAVHVAAKEALNKLREVRTHRRVKTVSAEAA